MSAHVATKHNKFKAVEKLESKFYQRINAWDKMICKPESFFNSINWAQNKIDELQKDWGRSSWPTEVVDFDMAKHSVEHFLEIPIQILVRLII